MNDAVLICARLLREGTVPRSELPALDHPDVRQEVERRLGEVGLVLATSAYSEHVGLRLSPDVTADSAFDAASNLGLRADACALLVVLWARLVLQKRTAADTRQVPGQAALFSHDRAEAAKEFQPQVRVETLAREFGSAIGSRTHLRMLVSQLRRLGFLAGRGDVIEAGPLLELAVDGEKMIAFIRRKVLSELLERGDGAGNAGIEEDRTGAELLAVIERLGGSAAMRDLARETGERPERLRSVLQNLEAEGRLKRSGSRFTTRYELPRS
ncbi:MAG: hypothetical protein ACREQY_13360 [Candidatus Binatia bacterium]